MPQSFFVEHTTRFLARGLRSHEGAQIAAAAVCGASVGAAIALIQQTIFSLHQWCFLLPDGMRLSTGIGANPWRLALVPAIGGLVLGLTCLVLRRVRRDDIIDPIEANALHGGRMSWIDSLRLLLTTTLSNAAGASVGMEAGYSQYGANVFSSVGQWFHLRRADVRIFVAAGAAAAIAAAYDAPLAGAFYGFELILGTYSIRALAPVGTAALCGVLVERILFPPEPVFTVGDTFHFAPVHYLLFAVLGVLAAGISVLAMRAVNWTERVFHHLPLPQWTRPAIGGAVLSAMALYVPQVLGSGHGAIQYQLDHTWAFGPLLILLFAKLIASAVSIGSGFRGGLFSSSLFLGCLFGALFADGAAMLVPSLGAQHTALMTVGMGTVAAGIIGAPLTMVFLVLEGTGDLSMTAGVMVGVVIATTIVRLSFGYSFSTWRFHLRGLKIQSAHDIGWLKDMTVASLMRADAPCLLETTTLDEARQNYPLGSKKKIFVIDAAGRYIGVLDAYLLFEASTLQTVGALAAAGDAVLLPNDGIKTALARFDDHQTEILPVLRSDSDRTVIGYITEAYALRRYSETLERRRNAELGQSAQP